VKPTAVMSALLRFTVDGAPRTKKNSSRSVRPQGRSYPRILPSSAFEQWRALALRQLCDLHWRRFVSLPFRCDVNCAAVFYRDRDIGDAVGYYQGLADLLQEARILVDDRQIVSWDGSRLAKDASRPRVDVTLSEIT